MVTVDNVKVGETISVSDHNAMTLDLLYGNHITTFIIACIFCLNSGTAPFFTNKILTEDALVLHSLFLPRFHASHSTCLFSFMLLHTTVGNLII